MFLVSYLSPAHMKVLGSKFRRYQVQTVTIIGYMISRKVRLVKAMVFLVVVYGCWEFNYKGSWVLKNWCFWTVLLEKTLESPLDFKEIQRVHPKGNQSWIFIGRTDAEAETPILCPIPAGAQGPAGLQSARSRAGPAGQSSVFCPLDFQRTLGCLEEPRRLWDFSAEGWSGKGIIN